MTRMFFSEAICLALAHEMESDPTVFLMGQDVGSYGGTYQDTRGLLERFGSERVRDTPIAEASCMGVAAGAAAAGMRPVVFVTYMDFLTLAMDALVNFAAKLHFKTGGQLAAPLVVKTTAGARGQGVAHAQSFISWLMGVPGLKVLVPSDANSAYHLMRRAIRDDGPVVFVDHRRLLTSAGDVALHSASKPETERLGDGEDLLIVSCSYGSVLAREARIELERRGIRTSVLDLHSLWPLDLTQVFDVAGRCQSVLLVEEGQLVCGVSAEIGYQISQKLGAKRTARVGPPRVPVSSNPTLEQESCIQAGDIIGAALRLVEGRSPSTAESNPQQLARCAVSS